MGKLAIFFRESRWGRILIPMGVILIVFSILMLKTDKANKNFVEVEGVVTKTELVQEGYTDTDGTWVDATYKVYVKYTADGKEYESVLGELPGFKEGDKVTFGYNPDDPTQISQKSGPLLIIIMFAGGVVAMAVGVVESVFAIRRIKAMKEQEASWNNG